MLECEHFEVRAFVPEEECAKIALIKSRIMAKDKEVLHFGCETQMETDMGISLNGKLVMTIEMFEILPFEKKLEIFDNGGKVFKILYNYIYEIKLPPLIENSESYHVLIKIDLNKIVTINYVQNKILSEEITRKIPAIENVGIKANLYDTFLRSEVPYLPNEEYQISYKIPQKVMVNANTNAVGIDLGTSRCFGAVNRRNGIETIALDNTGERHLPSYVSFHEGSELCGQIVVNRLQQNSKSTVFDSKRIIGRDYRNVILDPNWPFKVISMNDQPLIKIQYASYFVEKHPEDIAAVLLKHIKQKAEEIQGKKLNEVVITVPAAFNKKQQNATINAAKLAGWETIHLLPEPIAASFAYFVDRPIPTEFTLLLFDFGGGTLDVCLMKVSNGLLNVISIGGDANLGGRDFDNILYNHFSQILQEQYQINVNIKQKLKYCLIQRCMAIKHTLSSTDEDLLDISDYDQNIEKTLKISRQTFEKMAYTVLNKVREALISTLSTSNYTSKDIHKVLLVGGSSRMPMVQHLLRKVFSKAEHSSEENPDEVVAIGAAYYACYLKSITK